VKHAARLASRARIAYAEGVLDGLSGFDCGVVLIDHLGRVLRMNSRAETYLGYHLHVVASRLRASHRESNRLLQDLIVGLTRSVLVDRSPEATSVLLPRENNLPLIVSTYPVVRQASDVFQGACGFLIISDMTQERPLALPLLQRMFQLTPAELRVAEGLAYGLDTQQIATQHGIGAQTVRFHLKSIFAKTGTCHQAQLVALLARFDSQPR
jgi:DNA-binding CsgD family transcriptional regulator